MITYENLAAHAVLWTRGEPVPSLTEFDIYDHERAGLHSYEAKYFLAVEAARTNFIQQFSFAVPCSEVLDSLASLEPILEVGAGTGFWAHLMRMRGIDVWATDGEDESTRNTHSQVVAGFGINERLDGQVAVESYPGLNVFMCWPPYWTDWPERTLLAMERGMYLAVICDRAGVAGSAQFHGILETQFEEQVHLRVHQPNWPRIWDSFSVWRKK